MLKKNLPNHDFWTSPSLRKTVDYLTTEEYRTLISSENYFGYPYNPPGFEVPVSLAYLGNLSRDELEVRTKSWINGQLEKNYNSESCMLDQNNPDHQTLTARIYEVTRLPVDIAERVEIKLISNGAEKHA
jgi:hypothetical protein